MSHGKYNRPKLSLWVFVIPPVLLVHLCIFSETCLQFIITNCFPYCNYGEWADPFQNSLSLWNLVQPPQCSTHELYSRWLGVSLVGDPMYNASASFLDYSYRPLHFIRVIVCRDYLDCCRINIIPYAFKLLVSMDVHHLETSVRAHFYDVLDFF